MQQYASEVKKSGGKRPLDPVELALNVADVSRRIDSNRAASTSNQSTKSGHRVFPDASLTAEEVNSSNLAPNSSSSATGANHNVRPHSQWKIKGVRKNHSNYSPDTDMRSLELTSSHGLLQGLDESSSPALSFGGKFSREDGSWAVPNRDRRFEILPTRSIDSVDSVDTSERNIIATAAQGQTGLVSTLRSVVGLTSALVKGTVNLVVVEPIKLVTGLHKRGEDDAIADNIINDNNAVSRREN